MNLLEICSEVCFNVCFFLMTKKNTILLKQKERFAYVTGRTDEMTYYIAAKMINSIESKIELKSIESRMQKP